jgi:chorismate mutase
LTVAFFRKSISIPAMMILVDIKEQLEAIDQKIIHLMEERMHICKGQNLSGDEEIEMLSLWLEEAAEKGLDDVKIEKIAKILITMCRDTSE